MSKQAYENKKAYGGWLFLGVMLIIYGDVALSDFLLLTQALHTFFDVFLQILPILGLVFILMLVFNYALTPERIKKYLGDASGAKGRLLVIVAGIFSSGPIYTWYILLGQLKKQGMTSSLMAVFLYSRAIKLPMLPLLMHYFGVQFTIILSLYLICFSIVSGIVTGRLLNENQLLRK